jgi:hypothetical protein
VQIREGNNIFVKYFVDEADVQEFSSENRDLHLFGRKEVEVVEIEDAEVIVDTEINE